MTEQLHLGEDANLVTLRIAWERALNALSLRVNKPLYESCLKTIVPLEYSDKHVLLGASTSFAKFWVENKYLGLIRDIISDHLGKKVTVAVQVMEAHQGPAGTGDAEEVVWAQPMRPASHTGLAINDQHTFDTFVVGESNRMAFAAATAVAKTPGVSYNPLFYYGGSGLGKTHLLHAIGNFVDEYHPRIGWAYATAEAFTSEYVDAVSTRKTVAFRRRYRNIDILLMDDVQFLVGKERTKEEFFHTFNALHETGKQIVLTSDRAPKELDLEARLSSRFEAGLVVDIAPPELETRMAIIQSKADQSDLQIPNEVVLYIARLIRSNIRAIEGALLKLHAYASVMNVPVSTEMATDILQRYYEQPKENLITPEAVQTIVSRRFGVQVDDLNSSSREAGIVMARQIAMYLIRELTKSSLPAIGRVFGGKDHSTVLYAVKKISKLVVEDPRVADDVQTLRKELQGGA